MAKRPSKKVPHEQRAVKGCVCALCNGHRHKAAQTTGRAVNGCDCAPCYYIRKRAAETARNREQLKECGVLAKALNARLDAEEEYTSRMSEKYKDEPMTSVPVWFVHQG